jgi:hypothetical protein
MHSPIPALYRVECGGAASPKADPALKHQYLNGSLQTIPGGLRHSNNFQCHKPARRTRALLIFLHNPLFWLFLPDVSQVIQLKNKHTITSSKTIFSNWRVRD